MKDEYFRLKVEGIKLRVQRLWNRIHEYLICDNLRNLC